MKPPLSPIKIQLQKGAAVDDPVKGSPVAEVRLEQNRETWPEADTSEIAEFGASRVSKKLKNRLLDHPILVVGLYLLAATMLVWSLVFRLGDIHSRVAVEARLLTNRPLPELSGNGLTPEAVEALRRQLRQSHDYLVQGEEELVGLVADLERFSLEHGFKAMVSVKPPEAISSLGLAAVCYPVHVQLSASPSASSPSSSGYHGLVDYMAAIFTLQRKIECRAVRVQAAPDGVQTVELELLIWTKGPDEKDSSE